MNNLTPMKNCPGGGVQGNLNCMRGIKVILGQMTTKPFTETFERAFLPYFYNSKNKYYKKNSSITIEIQVL